MGEAWTKAKRGGVSMTMKLAKEEGDEGERDGREREGEGVKGGKESGGARGEKAKIKKNKKESTGASGWVLSVVLSSDSAVQKGTLPKVIGDGSPVDLIKMPCIFPLHTLSNQPGLLW